jgi:chemotaxis signal transduction protein
LNGAARCGLTLARLGPDLVGLDLSRVLAVLESPPITALPRIPGCCEGITVWQGRAIPVYDLKKALNLPSAEDDNIRRDSVVIVGRWRSSAVGLRVDEVLGVLESGAPEASGGGRPGLRGEAWHDGRRLLVLDPDADYPGSPGAQGASPRAA